MPELCALSLHLARLAAVHCSLVFADDFMVHSRANVQACDSYKRHHMDKDRPMGRVSDLDASTRSSGLPFCADGDHTSFHHQTQPLVASSERSQSMRHCQEQKRGCIPEALSTGARAETLSDVQTVEHLGLSGDILNSQDSTPLELSGTWGKRASLASARTAVLPVGDSFSRLSAYTAPKFITRDCLTRCGLSRHQACFSSWDAQL